jgi:hypothetical protein
MNPHTRYEYPPSDIRPSAMRVIRFIVAMVFALLIGCALEPLVRPSEGWFYTPKVTVLNVSAEIQQRVDDTVKKVVGK